MNCTRVGLTAFAAAVVTLTFALNISKSVAQNRDDFEYESRGTPPIERKVMGPLKAMDYSKGRIVLYTGGSLRNLRAVVEYLTRVGFPTEIVFASNEPGPLQIQADEYAVLANGNFGGIWGQYSINSGLAADIEVFAQNSGLEPTLFLQ
jgi:hypothetical protein